MDAVLDGRVVVITGAGRGLGRAYALDVARLGGRVVVNDLDAESAHATAELVAAAGGEATVVVSAVDRAGAGDELAAAALDRWGRLDGVVANAGVVGVASVFDQRAEDVRRMLEVNVVGVVETVVPVARAMRDSGTRGSIVLVTSGSRCGIPAMSAYGASKGAVATLCWAWALDCAPHGIRVNAISPMAATEMSVQADQVDPSLPEPEQIAPIVSYLLSDLSSALTGQVIRFTGDRMAVYPAPTIPADAVDGSWSEPAELAEYFAAAPLAAVGAALDLRVPLPAQD